MTKSKTGLRFQLFNLQCTATDTVKAVPFSVIFISFSTAKSCEHEMTGEVRTYLSRDESMALALSRKIPPHGGDMAPTPLPLASAGRHFRVRMWALERSPARSTNVHKLKPTNSPFYWYALGGDALPRDSTELRLPRKWEEGIGAQTMADKAIYTGHMPRANSDRVCPVFEFLSLPPLWHFVRQVRNFATNVKKSFSRGGRRSTVKAKSLNFQIRWSEFLFTSRLWYFKILSS